MAKWKSQYQSQNQENEDRYQQFFKQVYPQLAEKMQAYVDSYDESQPVEPDMQTLANAPLALMQQRMAKYCVWPAIRAIETNQQDHGRAVTQSIEKFMKPLQEAYNAKKREEDKARRAAFIEAAKGRPIVMEGMFRSSSEPGDIVRVQDRHQKTDQILTCISCEYIRAAEDYGQYDSGYYIKYAEPTEEEKQTDRYKRAKEAMEIDLKHQETLRRNARTLLDRNEW